MNNQIFDVNRFAKVFVREFNRYKFKLLGILAVFLGLFVLSIAYSYVFNTTPLKISYKFVGVTLVAIAPIIFSRDINRINAIFDFTMPASTLERFLARWALCVIVMPLLIVAFLLFIAVLHLIMPGGNCVAAGNDILHFLSHLTFENISFMAAMQSFFLVGVYYFHKRAFIKVCMCLVAYSFLFGLVFAFSHQYLFQGGSHAYNFGIDIFNDSAQMQVDNSSFAPTTNSLITIILNVIAPIGLWVVSFLKLRETEI